MIEYVAAVWFVAGFICGIAIGAYMALKMVGYHPYDSSEKDEKKEEI